MKKDEDGSITIIFGGDPRQPYFLPIMPAWNYILRIAGVYMFSIGTIWTRAEVMPRWLTLITYLLALVFLFFAGSIREARFVFSAWVFLTSIYILITNRRLERREISTIPPNAQSKAS